jgi:predicted nucleotidyltransferase
MKTLSELKNEQEAEVRRYRALADRVVREFVQPREGIIGVLLAGSVARGDARRGPFGLSIDLVIVAEHREDVDLTAIFGPSIEPFIPKHCVKVDDTGVAIELTTRKDLEDIRSRWEPEIYARHESVVLYDKTEFLSKWKSDAFNITDEQRKDRALYWFFRCQYLVGDYRIEKWKHRAAWVQMCQIGNEAAECWQFIPRKDWVTYLTYELPDKAPGHEHLLEAIYTSIPTEQEVDGRFKRLSEALSWMSTYCRERRWIN